MTQTHQEAVPQAEAAGPKPTTGKRFLRSRQVVENTQHAQRPRHDVPAWARPFLRLVFRYSYSRDAWVLYGIGKKRGPVIRSL